MWGWGVSSLQIEARDLALPGLTAGEVDQVGGPPQELWASLAVGRRR